LGREVAKQKGEAIKAKEEGLYGRSWRASCLTGKEKRVLDFEDERGHLNTKKKAFNIKHKSHALTPPNLKKIENKKWSGMGDPATLLRREEWGIAIYKVFGGKNKVNKVLRLSLERKGSAAPGCETIK